MKDLKFEQKKSLSRLEAADLLSAIAAALRHGDGAELDFGPGTVSLRIPEELRSEIEIEVGDGQLELEVELKWPVPPAGTESPRPAAGSQDESSPD
ncbi:amphi-Trp domain-containing protein [Streptomyces sp. CB01881]|uniref:amphi-Trp domain-containing protein n=1 Tax=Streptomyces sp. CB01881 TaxID=2078691 RepID=UPI000CDC4516|nr:amphi-Trp domain-containing protein [Streptomyces sp. CB01881]AUY52037.1 amphi-Trp domain-containing protein [Streptomyces sp. CB01881]TYC71467.1 amphi-Trp domain-containing protein [Streptomyces sp. CB01881]